MELLENNLSVIKKDISAPKSYVSLLNLNGEYDKAIDFLKNHHFRTWEGGREKAPAAICRKVANACDEDSIEVWGDGHQTRSFLYIDECIEATCRIMDSECTEPLNIGSEEMVTINQLVDIAAEIAGKKITKDHIDGPLGVRGRNSNNDLIREKLGWDYEMTLEEGMKKTYEWVRWQVSKQIYAEV